MTVFLQGMPGGRFSNLSGSGQKPGCTRDEYIETGWTSFKSRSSDVPVEQDLDTVNNDYDGSDNYDDCGVDVGGDDNDNDCVESNLDVDEGGNIDFRDEGGAGDDDDKCCDGVCAVDDSVCGDDDDDVDDDAAAGDYGIGNDNDGDDGGGGGGSDEVEEDYDMFYGCGDSCVYDDNDEV
ncbi:prostatic spermine-binding protein-like [Mercenaria mercenaria]|uniref:prostatic spermine-binding protein-like n=1 Tax=Mercenaria mercenaria TaxID=6596 RepID=UPI00234FA198|nr:prostatic spermine-binding protein-like [Mercenaria mercenaria]